MSASLVAASAVVKPAFSIANIWFKSAILAFLNSKMPLLLSIFKEELY
jgi:hypothetical protein